VNRDATLRAQSRPLVLAATVLGVALFGPGTASAHDLIARVNPSVDPIRVEAGYDDGTPAEAARATVTDADGNAIASGILDDKGMWSFPRPGPGRYEIVVELAGHRDAVVLVIEDESPAVSSRWRLDKDLGRAIGLTLLLGGTLAFILLRRRKRTVRTTSEP